MTYAQPNKVTLIENLPELSDLEGPQSMEGVGRYNQPPDPSGNGDNKQYQKFIRNGYNGTQHIPESGMTPNQHSGMNQYQQQYQPQPQPQQQYQQQSEQQPHRRYDSPTCLEIHDHVSSCPICSRFFKTDNTVYIIAIVILSIICILLLKRVLNV